VDGVQAVLDDGSPSPAALADLRAGDVIVAFDGAPVQRMDDLVALLTSERVGQPARIRLIRAGAEEERTIIVGERPRAEARP